MNRSAPPVAIPAAESSAKPRLRQMDMSHRGSSRRFAPPAMNASNINPKIFAYDGHHHAYIKDPKGGPYKDLVRAAEKCTAQVIHPGTPADPNEKDAAKLLLRAAKYN